MANAAIILAAGRGARIQDLVSDKVLAPLAGRPVIAYSVAAFQQSGSVTQIVIAYRDPAQREALATALANIGEGLPKDLIWVPGGTERQDSVLAGLQALPDSTELVFIHDAARPLLTPQTIRALAAAAQKSGAACLARRVTDTIKQTAPVGPVGSEAVSLRTVDRARLWAVETPQVFSRDLIVTAYQKVRAAGLHVTDDTSALEASGHPVTLIESRTPNPKLTTPADLAYLEYLVKSPTEALQ